MTTASYDIPFNKPYFIGKELAYIAEAVALGNISGDGKFTRACEEILTEQFGIAQIFMTPSCTASLEMAAMLSDLGPGDEVIVPSYTFVSTVNAFARLGAKPVFVDIRPDTLNMDESLVEARITPHTKAIIPVHYAGVACQMDRIMAIADKHQLVVIEDAAQGVHAFYRNQALGSIGHLGAYSFHETKNYICGEGGALCINTSKYADRAEIIRDKGTNRKQFFRGEVDKYTWVDIGSSYLLGELCSAFLYAQLENMESIAARRKNIFANYQEALTPLEREGLLRLPVIPDSCQANYHMFYILLRDESTRNELIGHLRDQGIQAVFHYVPLHTSPMGQSFGYHPGSLPVTEDLSSRLLRLPFYYDITPKNQERVCSAIQSLLHRLNATISSPSTANS